MSATPPRSCFPTWLPRLPARSSTSTPGSATWWPGSAARAALLLLQISVADLDVGARAQARDIGVVLGRAEQLARAAGVRGLLLRRLRLGLDHLRNAHQQVACFRRRHAEVSRQLGNVRRHDPPQYFRRQALRVAPRHRARRAPFDAGVAALAQLLELGCAVLLGERRRFALPQQVGDLALHLVEAALRGRLVLDDARGHQRTGSDLDGVGVALVLDRILREQRREQLRVVERAEFLAGRLADPAGALHRQLEALGGRLQAVGLLVDEVAEVLRGLGEFPRALLPRQLVAELLAHLLERARLAGLDAGQAHDVVAELALHDLQVILLELEDRVIEGLHHHAAAEPAEVPAFRRRPGVLRMLLRQLGEAPRGLF